MILKDITNISYYVYVRVNGNLFFSFFEGAGVFAGELVEEAPAGDGFEEDEEGSDKENPALPKNGG